MKRASGGVVKVDAIHKIGDDHCSHCVPFPDPDYTLDVGLMHPDTIIPPITIDMTLEQIKEIQEEIRKQVRTKIKLREFLY